MFGKEYVSQHVLQTIKAEQKEFSYRVYITDTLRIISENTAKYACGSYMQARWIDVIKPQPEETRTGKEIIDHIKNKLAQL